jgi:hypothetical protein
MDTIYQRSANDCDATSRGPHYGDDGDKSAIIIATRSNYSPSSRSPKPSGNSYCRGKPAAPYFGARLLRISYISQTWKNQILGAIKISRRTICSVVWDPNLPKQIVPGFYTSGARLKSSSRTPELRHSKFYFGIQKCAPPGFSPQRRHRMPLKP